MIGLSLSFCVRELAIGDGVKLSEVEKIVSGTREATDEDWEGLLKSYKETYWSWHGCDPDRAEQIARQLIADGKIEQPRLENNRHYPMLNEPGKRWVSSEEEIVWSDRLEAAQA